MRGAPISCVLTPDECNLNIAGAITGRGLFCVALPGGPGPADTIEGAWVPPWGIAGGAWIWFPDSAAFADAVQGGFFALGDSAGEGGFGFLTDEHLQTLSREFGLALGDSVWEAGFGLHYRLSEEDCLVAGYSQRPEETFVVGYSPMQHLIF